jgi:hypothetical protein
VQSYTSLYQDYLPTSFWAGCHHLNLQARSFDHASQHFEMKNSGAEAQMVC